MNAYHYYVLTAGCFACYVLGRKHERGQSGWKNTTAALIAGAVWPVMIGWGAWIAHSGREGDQS